MTSPIRVLMNDVDHPVISQWVRAAQACSDVSLLRAGGVRRQLFTIATHRVERVGSTDVSVSSLQLRPDRYFWRTNDAVQARALVALIGRLERSDIAPSLLHGHFAAASRGFALAGRKASLPVVITEHSTAMTGLNPLKPLTPVRRAAAMRAYSAATLVLPVSAFLRDRMREAGFDVPMTVVPNPVDTSRFFPAGGAVDECRVVSVARLDPVKRLDLALQAFALVRKEVPEARYVIVGDGPDRPRLETMSQHLGLERAVRFTGRLAPVAVAAELRSCGVFLSTSLVETFGVAAVEALASGCRVVTTPDTPVGDLAAPPHVMVAPGGSPSAIAECLSGVMATGSGERTARHELAVGRYSIEAVAPILDRVYQRLTEGARTRPRSRRF